MPSRSSSIWAEVTLAQGQPSQHPSMTLIPHGQLLLGSSPLDWPTLHQICIMIQFIVWSSPCSILLLLPFSIRSASVWRLSLLNSASSLFYVSHAVIYSKSLVFLIPSQCLLLRGPVNIPSLPSHYSKGLTLSSHPHTQKQCLFDTVYYRDSPAHCSPGMQAPLLFFKWSKSFLLQNFTLPPAWKALILLVQICAMWFLVIIQVSGQRSCSLFLSGSFYAKHAPSLCIQYL